MPRLPSHAVLRCGEGVAAGSRAAGGVMTIPSRMVLAGRYFAEYCWPCAAAASYAERLNKPSSHLLGRLG